MNCITNKKQEDIMDKKFTFQELQAIVAALRSENGCPWDRAQTHESLKLYTLEEACEVNQAVTDLTKTGNPDNLREELGDLLFQVLIQSQISEENGEFTLEDVIDGIARKMIHRHPHVFAGRTYASTEEQQADWEKLKAQEAGHKELSAKEDLSGIPVTFPALIRGQKTAKKAVRHALLSENEEDILKELLRSVLSLTNLASSKDASKNPDASSKSADDSLLSDKLGEVLFTLCRFSTHYGLSGEMALIDQIERFIYGIK